MYGINFVIVSCISFTMLVVMFLYDFLNDKISVMCNDVVVEVVFVIVHDAQKLNGWFVNI